MKKIVLRMMYVEESLVEVVLLVLVAEAAEVSVSVVAFFPRQRLMSCIALLMSTQFHRLALELHRTAPTTAVVLEAESEACGQPRRSCRKRLLRA